MIDSYSQTSCYYSHSHPQTECKGVAKRLKGIVDFEITVWYVLSYLKGIQDVGVCFRRSFNFDIFRSNRSCLSVI